MSEIIYKCDCGKNLRFPSLKKKIKVTCPACGNFFYFENGCKTPDNFTLIAKNITYCCEAIKQEFPSEKKLTRWLWGMGLATQQYRLAGQISLKDLLTVIMENESDFETIVTKLIILELDADSPQISLEEITEITLSKRPEIIRAIEEAKKEFSSTDNVLAQYARLGAKCFPKSDFDF
ncbi:MAG: hypothetical protein KJ550_06515 [Proteobacteria bacterium]|nr:hypothetical protein [Desulfobacteraceae bacterium]MBU4013101.1 hypothetical protein [Pseudomonadota bacterium]MBU4100883.1 hypothetical protein [Pseudomonadota bacterium]